NEMYDKAIETFLISLDTYKKIGSKIGSLSGQARQLANIGLTYYNMKEYDKALFNLQAAKKIFEECKLNRDVYRMEAIIAEIEQQLKKSKPDEK
ncbi:MAG: hypothetical protein JXA92_04070, partial [candidate division Zixibacteria bacterium]|nr:hypothetical protein [candidate division Zixibacteria bacterium]